MSHSATCTGSAVAEDSRFRSPVYVTRAPSERMTRSCADPRMCPAGSSSRHSGPRSNGRLYGTGRHEGSAPSRCDINRSVARVAMTRSCRAMWSEWAWLTNASGALRCASSQSAVPDR